MTDLRGSLAKKPSEIKLQQAWRVQSVWSKVNWVRFVFFVLLFWEHFFHVFLGFAFGVDVADISLASHPAPEQRGRATAACCQSSPVQALGHNQTVITQTFFSLPSLSWNAEWCALSGGSGTRTCVSLYSSTLVSMATIEIAGLLYKLVGEIQNTSPYAAASWNSFSSSGYRLLPSGRGCSVGVHWVHLLSGTAGLLLENSACTQVAPFAALTSRFWPGRWSASGCTTQVPGGGCFVPSGSILPLSGCKVNERVYILACYHGDLCQKAIGRT